MLLKLLPILAIFIIIFSTYYVTLIVQYLNLELADTKAGS